MEWYPRKPQKYRNATWGLSLAAHGAYCLLIDYYYQSEAPLPADDNAIAGILGCRIEEWLSVKESVTRYFRVSNAHLTHDTCDEVIMSAMTKRRDGALRVAKYRKNLDTVTRYSRVSNALEERREEEIKKETPIGVSKENSPDLFNDKPIEVKNGKRGTRLATDWQPSSEYLDFAASLGVDGWAEADKFRDYWIAKPGQAGCKLDWDATWRNWCRNGKRNPVNGGNGNSRTGGNGRGSLLAAAQGAIEELRRRKLNPS
jgi:uncharacterized protein YdaU (DUF1376 family)